MSTTKKNIKVRDLKPSKDAKGGGGTRNSLGANSLGKNTAGTNTHSTNTHGRNRHHGHGNN